MNCKTKQSKQESKSMSFETYEEVEEYYSSIPWESNGFDRVENKLSKDPYLHGMLRLEQVFGNKTPIIQSAEHEIIYLLEGEASDLDLSLITKDLLLELNRCGIWFECENYGFYIDV